MRFFTQEQGGRRRVRKIFTFSDTPFQSWISIITKEFSNHVWTVVQNQQWGTKPILTSISSVSLIEDGAKSTCWRISRRESGLEGALQFEIIYFTAVSDPFLQLRATTFLCVWVWWPFGYSVTRHRFWLPAHVTWWSLVYTEDNFMGATLVEQEKERGQRRISEQIVLWQFSLNTRMVFQKWFNNAWHLGFFTCTHTHTIPYIQVVQAYFIFSLERFARSVS